MKKHLLVLTLLPFACSDDPTPPPVVDMNADMNVEDISEDFTEDTSTDDSVMEDIPCSRDTDCPRGTTCHVNICAGATGCTFLSFPDLGCYFEHDLDTDQGLFTAAECESDEECPNSEEPTCIARVCSNLTPCEVDEECPGSQTCRHRLYCK